MKFSKIFGVLVVVILGFITVKQVQSLECYNCKSCNDPFDKSANDGSTITCLGSCLKINYDEKAERSCSLLNLGDFCGEIVLDGHKANGCSCTSDKCNSSNSVHVSLISVLIFLAAAFLLKSG